jgi:succinate dehydrogenase/fumarate reductase flavoprotein subunit
MVFPRQRWDTTEVNKQLFSQYAKSGEGPIYMDCRGISNEDLEYMMHWLKHEGNEALINHLNEEGIDLRCNPVEFMTHEMFSLGAIRSNAKTETSVKGLYAAGDETLGGISAAATFGWIAGENAAEYAKRAESFNSEKENTKIHEKKRLLDEIRSRRVGPDWREANIALQQVMNDYAGSVRSESLLGAGLSHIRRLKKKVGTAVTAKNQHELVRVLEIINLLDLAELVLVAANERKETRGLHFRTDYPFTDPLLDKLLVVRRENEKAVTKWIEIGRWEH